MIKAEPTKKFYPRFCEALRGEFFPGYSTRQLGPIFALSIRRTLGKLSFAQRKGFSLPKTPSSWDVPGSILVHFYIVSISWIELE
jgi:hypothetical protein